MWTDPTPALHHGEGGKAGLRPTQYPPRWAQTCRAVWADCFLINECVKRHSEDDKCDLLRVVSDLLDRVRQGEKVPMYSNIHMDSAVLSIQQQTHRDLQCVGKAETGKGIETDNTVD